MSIKEKEFKPILDRQKHEKDAADYFSKHTELLVDMANYGSNLIPRAFDSSDKKTEDVVVIGVLLGQIVAMVDAVEVLITKAAVLPAMLPARSAFEALLYLEWIMKDESERRAKYYFVAGLRSQRQWALRFVPDTLEAKAFAETYQHLDEYMDRAALEQLEGPVGEEREKIETLLAQPGWAEINADFERRKIKRSGIDRSWYAMLGIPNVWKLAKKVGQRAEYALCYTRSSEVMHSATYADRVRSGQGTIMFEPVRQLRDANFVLRFIMQTAMSGYLAITTRYGHGERDRLVKKYMEDWRQAFLNVPSVSYKPPDD